MADADWGLLIMAMAVAQVLASNFESPPELGYNAARSQLCPAAVDAEALLGLAIEGVSVGLGCRLANDRLLQCGFVDSVPPHPANHEAIVTMAIVQPLWQALFYGLYSYGPGAVLRLI